MNKADRCPECAIVWRVAWSSQSQQVQSLEAAIFAVRSIKGAWIEVYSPSLGRWLKVETPQ